MANCPICGRHLGTFSNDPILTTPSLSTEEFKGFTTLIRQHIEELQTERHQQEIDNGISPLTEFSLVNNTGFFQNIKQYILELRDSTEKILTATGLTLNEFLSTDEDGNPMTSKSEWTDPNLEEIKYQCKAIHIEDLRHFVGFATEDWEEDWTGAAFSYSNAFSHHGNYFINLVNPLTINITGKHNWVQGATYQYVANIFSPPPGIWAGFAGGMTIANSNVILFAMAEGILGWGQQIQTYYGWGTLVYTFPVGSNRVITNNSTITVQNSPYGFSISGADFSVGFPIAGTYSLSAYAGKTIINVNVEFPSGGTCVLDKWLANTYQRRDFNAGFNLTNIQITKLRK